MNTVMLEPVQEGGSFFFIVDAASIARTKDPSSLLKPSFIALSRSSIVFLSGIKQCIAIRFKISTFKPFRPTPCFSFVYLTTEQLLAGWE